MGMIEQTLLRWMLRKRFLMREVHRWFVLCMRILAIFTAEALGEIWTLNGVQFTFDVNISLTCLRGVFFHWSTIIETHSWFVLRSFVDTIGTTESFRTICDRKLEDVFKSDAEYLEQPQRIRRGQREYLFLTRSPKEKYPRHMYSVWMNRAERQKSQVQCNQKTVGIKMESLLTSLRGMFGNVRLIGEIRCWLEWISLIILDLFNWRNDLLYPSLDPCRTFLRSRDWDSSLDRLVWPFRLQISFSLESTWSQHDRFDQCRGHSSTQSVELSLWRYSKRKREYERSEREMKSTS